MNLPLTDSPAESFSIELFGVVYRMQQMWNTNGFWTLNIADVEGNPIVDGVKLVAKTKLLRQYPSIPFELESTTETDPTRNNLSEFILVVTEKNG